MFKILENPEATSTQLRETYIEAEKLVKALSIEKEREYKALMVAQVECFSAKPTKEFLTAKKKLDDISTRIEGCKFGQEQIKARLGEVLQKEARQRLEEIEGELDSLAIEERKFQEAFLSMAAEAVVLKEKIKGRSLLSDSQGAVTAGIPSLKVELHLLDSRDGAFYSQEVKRFRQEIGAQNFSETIRGRRDNLVQESDRLERRLSGDPQEAAEELLNRLIPSPAPEPDEPESRKTSSFVRDYGKIGGPDYEEGPSLPYRGVGEILAERANS